MLHRAVHVLCMPSWVSPYTIKIELVPINSHPVKFVALPVGAILARFNTLGGREAEGLLLSFIITHGSRGSNDSPVIITPALKRGSSEMLPIFASRKV